MWASIGTIVAHLNDRSSLELKLLPDLHVKVRGNDIAPKNITLDFLLYIQKLLIVTYSMIV
jgi:hypothetical protein